MLNAWNRNSMVREVLREPPIGARRTRSVSELLWKQLPELQ